VEESEAVQRSGFAAILPVVSGPMTLEHAMQEDVAARGVSRTVEQIVRLLNLNSKDNE
jgi:glycerate kinase